MKNLFFVTLILCILISLSMSVFAANFPEKDITYIMGSSLGGSVDLASKALMPSLGRELGVNVITEILQGANGAVAAYKLQLLPPDGYTLFIHSQSLIMMQYTGQPSINIKKLQPICQIAEDTSSIAVPIDAPYDTLEEFVAYAKANPGKVTVGTAGMGSIWHIAGILFEKAAGIKFKFIPYDTGGAQATVACASGEVDAITNSPGEQRSLAESKKIKILAVLSESRHILFPDVPTAKEVGIDVVFPVWRIIWTTAGVPEERLQILDKAIKKATESEEYKTFMSTAGFPIRYRGYEEINEFVKQEDQLYSDILEELGIKFTEPYD